MQAHLRDAADYGNTGDARCSAQPHRRENAARKAWTLFPASSFALCCEVVKRTTILFPENGCCHAAYIGRRYSSITRILSIYKPGVANQFRYCEICCLGEHIRFTERDARLNLVLALLQFAGIYILVN